MNGILSVSQTGGNLIINSGSKFKTSEFDCFTSMDFNTVNISTQELDSIFE